MVGPGIELLTRAPAAGGADPGQDATSTCGRSTPTDASSLPGSRRAGGHHRPPGVHAGAARTSRALTSPAWRRSPAPSPVRPRRRRGRPAPALPVRLGQALQGLPRCRGRRGRRLRRPAVRGAAVGVRRRRAARAGAGGDGPAHGARARRPDGAALHPAARWPRRRWCATAARSGSASRCSTTSATRRATWAPCSQAALDADEPGIVGLTDPPGDGPRLQDLVTRRAARRHRPRRLRLLDRRRRATRRPRGRAGAGQRRGQRRPRG